MGRLFCTVYSITPTFYFLSCLTKLPTKTSKNLEGLVHWAENVLFTQFQPEQQKAREQQKAQQKAREQQKARTIFMKEYESGVHSYAA